MPSAAVTPNPLVSLLTAGQERSADAAGRSAGVAAGPKAGQAAEPAREAESASVIVSLSEGEPPAIPAAPVFAEIWLAGRKVGEVYADGQASLPGVAGGFDLLTPGSGTALARQRAEEIARMIGAEVRYADATDLQVARTRAQLHRTYGV